jgi:DNA-binding MarR family transcriptional regulator
MAFDPVVANVGRLRILAALAAQGAEFVELRARTRMTDGNLSSHARRLEAAGMIRIVKSFRDGRPVTRMEMTSSGRARLEAHARELLEAVGLRNIHEPSAHEEEWVD